MQKYIRSIITGLAIVIAMTIVAIAAVLINPRLAANERATFISPGGAYRLIVYVYGFPSFAIPGQGSDRDGFARVYNATGRLLCELDISLAGQVYEKDVRWSGNSVALPGKNGLEGCPLS